MLTCKQGGVQLKDGRAVRGACKQGDVQFKDTHPRRQPDRHHRHPNYFKTVKPVPHAPSSQGGVQLGAGVPATAPTAGPAEYEQEWATVPVVPPNHSFTCRTLAISLDLISYRRTSLVKHGRGLKHYE